MAFPQGINFRSTSVFVTDGANEDAEIGTTANYPRTTAQGNTVGWEQAPDGTRNRVSTGDRRLAGMAFLGGSGTADYRIDLPATGGYSIRAAFGDASFPQNSIKVEFFDGSTSLGVVCDGLTGTASPNRFFDATGVLRTSQSDWVTNNAAATKTFATTIFRVRLTWVQQSCTIAHLFIESAGGGVGSGVGSASGTSTASGVGASTAASTGSASGTGAATGVGASTAATTGSAAGSATVSGVGVASTGSAGSAAGTSTVSGVGASVAASVGSAAGAATVSGVGASTSAGSAVGAAAGTSTVSGVGASIAAAVGSAAGASTVNGVTNGVVEAPRMIGGGWRQPGSRRRKFLINGEVVEAFDDEIALIYAAYGLLELEEQQARPKKKKKAKAKKPFPYRPGELLNDALPANTTILAEAVNLAEQRLKASEAGRMRLAEIAAQRTQRLLEEEEEWMLLVA